MGFRCGIIGLPNVGKTTVFNALANASADVANYPFTTIEPNVGKVRVPDKRLEYLKKIFTPPKTTYTTLEFFDIAGLVKGASKGEGLGNQFLGHIRDVDAIAHVVKCFKEPNAPSVSKDLSPGTDIEIVETELILSDLSTVEKNIEKSKGKILRGDKETKEEYAVLLSVKEGLEKGFNVRDIELLEDSKKHLEKLCFLTSKPSFYIANLDDSDIGKDNILLNKIKQYAQKRSKEVVEIYGKLELELGELESEEAMEYMSTLGINHLGIDDIIKVGYRILNLITFYTTVGKELRAWTLLEGTKAEKAAGKIHSDIEKGFVKAEVVSFDNFSMYGSMAHVKERGLLRIEGRNYIIRDGDIVFFRFNV
jgi:GTP-binding protein YchF